jgi:hypothetical protein
MHWVDDAFQVDRHDLVPDIEFHFQCRTVAPEPQRPGDVGETVDAAEGVDRARAGSRYFGFVGQIALDVNRLVRISWYCFGLRLEVEHQHLRTGGQQVAGDAITHATSGTGDESHLLIELLHSNFPRLLARSSYHVVAAKSAIDSIGSIYHFCHTIFI